MPHSIPWLKVLLASAFAVGSLQLLFLANLSMLYGSLSSLTGTAHRMRVLFVDYDNGVISESVQTTYQDIKDDGFPSINQVSAADYPTIDELEHAVCQNRHLWGAVFVRPGSSQRLASALLGQNQALTYNASDVLGYIWNGARYPAFSQAMISAPIRQLLLQSVTTYTLMNSSYIYRHSNLSDDTVFKVLATPWQIVELNIMPTVQGPRVLYNTATMAMAAVSQFFFVLGANGVNSRFDLYSKLSTRGNVLLRGLLSFVYAFSLAATNTGTIWAFRNDWNVSTSQGVETWLCLTFLCNIHVLIIDAITGVLSPKWYPFFVVTYALLNVTSCIVPLNLAPGFYKWSYIMPGYEAYQLLITIWSRGCAPSYEIALPVMFAWWTLGLLGSCLSMVKRCRHAKQRHTTQEPGPLLTRHNVGKEYNQEVLIRNELPNSTTAIEIEPSE